MVKNGRSSIILIIIGLIALATTLFFAARYRRINENSVIGRISDLDGRIEIRDARSQAWKPAASNDPILSDSSLKTGPGGMLKIVGPMGSVLAGPDTSIEIESSQAATRIHLLSGEITVKHGSIPGNLLVVTPFGSLNLSSLAEMIVSRPAGQQFALVEARAGEAKATPSSGEATLVSSLNSPFLLSNPKDPAIWINSPAPEQFIIAKEGFAAVLFSWHSNKPLGNANILVRNLATGEMTIHEASKAREDITLASGSYSWSVNTGGLISGSRRFHVKGDTPTDGIADRKIASVARKVATSDSTADATKEPSAIKPQSEAAPVLERPKIKIVEPTEGLSIPVESLTEQRVHWSATGDVDSIDLEILGSSGNPAKQFTLEGDRTRRRLPALPPGRYTVRVRANGIRDDVTASSAWAETFFDVVQTEPGQLAPSDVKVSTTKKGNTPYILIEWSKSTAPRYQVTMTTSDAPAKVARTTKSQVLLNMPKDTVKDIEVCALDANLQVRGCAPKIEEPQL
jgi:hypothetical protein